MPELIVPLGLVCGVDEAGRGPLAGPVVAAAVILDPDRPIPGLNDSKKTEREKTCCTGSADSGPGAGLGVG